MFDPRLFSESLATAAIGRFFLYRTVVETTMTVARREADEGAPHGTLILAEEQTAGRGRRGRSFYSPPGENLYFTLVLRPDSRLHSRLPVIVPLAVARACSIEGVAARIKWPNDIWVGARKLSGMLIDSETGPAGAVVYPGIGINVNGDPTINPELRDIATSLFLETGRHITRELLLARVCNELESLAVLPDSELGDAYRESSMIVGKRVLVAAGDMTYEADAVAVDPSGALVVRRDDGTDDTLLAAEVTIRPA
ncbi:MAG: biotin--[acetyl-CoA-carboxylase] ligase [Tepidiformaceae bacterium]